jgi:hypothetical protein
MVRARGELRRHGPRYIHLSRYPSLSSISPPRLFSSLYLLLHALHFDCFFYGIGCNSDAFLACSVILDIDYS